MRGLVLGGLALACARGAQAQAQSGWSGDLGAAARARPDHVGARTYTLDAVPVIDIHYGDSLQVSLDDGVKWTAVRAGGLAFGPVAEYRQAYSDGLAPGVRRPQNAIEIGGFAAYRLPFGQAEVRLRRAVDGYQGWSGDLSFDTGGRVSRRWQVGAEARLGWADDAYTDAYFGARRRTARRLGLPRFQENDFTTAGFELDVARDLTANARLVAALAYDRVIGPADPTPSLLSRDIPTLTLGLTYRWPAPRAHGG